MARAKQTARKQGARTPVDKGTYGNIKKSTSSSSSNADKALSSGSKKKKALSCAEKREKRKKKKEKERSSINSNGSVGNNKKKAAKKKRKTDNSTPSWVLDYQREQKFLKKNGKVPPKSARHHSTKKKRSSAISASQQQRDFRATPYNANPPYMSSSKKPTKYPGRTRPLPKNVNTPRKTRSGKLRLGLRKKLHCTSFQMSISECNDKVYLQKVDCPWYDSELDGQSSTATTAHRGDDNKDDSSSDSDDNKKQPSRNAKSSKSNSSSNNNSSNTLTLPSESILSQIDTEIQQFTSYIKLNPSEYKARLSFIEHVTELSIEQFQGHGNYNNNNSIIPRYQGANYKGGRSASMINNDNTRYNRKRTLSESLGDFANQQHQKEKEESSSIHVAPFGSFATQDVCTFASDVDMCLWGVVKGAASTSSSKPQMFIGDNEDNGVNNSDGEGDSEVVMDSTSGCPLLTESSLLRTMDAIQAAGHDITSPTSKKSKGGKNKSQSVADGDSLFFIDRVGEAQNEDGRDDVEVIDLCDDNSTPKDEMNSQEKKSSQSAQPNQVDEAAAKRVTEDLDSKAASSDFQFVIDKKGVQELGGDTDESLPIEEKQSRQEEAAGIDQTDELKSPIDEADTQKINKAKAKDDTNDDDDSEVIVVDSDSDSDDDADPMASYYNRQDGNNPANNEGAPASSGSVVLLDDDSSSDEEDNAVEDLTQDDSSSSEEEDESSSPQTPQKKNEVLELSVTSNKPTLDRRESSSSIVRYADKPSFGPTGKARTHVVSALLSLTRQLKRSSHVHTIECRSKARVPIINCSTRTGFEGDIAIGGHNGVDTSMYALSQVQRFSSFAPIVLILKVIMAQQDLDKPFTGGLGSYKLYVLVAYHIDCHLASGGRDRPSEILISLLFRYGRMGKKRDKATTDLEQLKIREECVSTGGGMCELSPVFRLSDCVDLFQECHGRLSDRFLLVEDGGFDEKIAYLSSIIDCFRLIKARDTSKQRARLCDNLRRPIAHNDPGKVNPGRKIGTVFTKSGAVRDDTSTMKRGPRGGLVPKQRPDLDAKKSLGGDAAVIQRGMKNRKNNKKQKRDTALKEFASSHY